MFKRVQPKDYTVTPFQANKLFRLDQDSDYVSQHLGVNVVNEYFNEETSQRNDLDGYYYKNIYELVNHFYYRSSEPFQKFGIEDSQNINLLFPDYDFASIQLLKINNQLFGEKIFPGSFNVTFSLKDEDEFGNPILQNIEEVYGSGTERSDFDFKLVDDGVGNVFLERTGNQVGNIFYRNGVVVITDWKKLYDQEFDSGVSFNVGGEYQFDDDDASYEESGFTDFAISNIEYLFDYYNYEIEFRSVLTHYEHEIICTADTHEFNGITNPTVRDGEGGFIDYFENQAQDRDGNVLQFRPFITTVGLYDEFLNLLAVGKLARPIQKPEDTPLTLVVRFDT